MKETEEPQVGGLTPGRVVKVGDTVRRAAGPWTPTIFALLEHLSAKGFPASAPLGLDDQGRERLSWLPGRAANYPWPPALIETAGAKQAGAFVRAYHVMVADFVPPKPAVWRHGQQTLGPGEVVLHGDFAPHNMIWDERAPTGLIDFELARPGQSIEDAAFCVCRVACLRDDAGTLRMGFASPPDRRARFAAFAEGWGGTVTALLAATRTAMTTELTRMLDLGAAGLDPWAGFLRAGLADDVRAELAWLDANVAALS